MAFRCKPGASGDVQAAGLAAPRIILHPVVEYGRMPVSCVLPLERSLERSLERFVHTAGARLATVVIGLAPTATHDGGSDETLRHGQTATTRPHASLYRAFMARRP